MVNEQDGTASDELDAEALCSMLDQDSDFDGELFHIILSIENERFI